MDCLRKLHSLVKTRQGGEVRGKTKQREEVKSFLENGSAFLEEILVSFNGKHNIPIRGFTTEEIARATNGFTDLVWESWTGSMFKGSFEQRPILVKTFHEGFGFMSDLSEAVRDMAITSQMSHHKNVLKLLGCCLESQLPWLVYEFPGTNILSGLLSHYKDGNYEPNHNSLSWKTRIRIAKDIANVVVYLHTAFPTPIVHRDIKLQDVFMDPNAVVKLYDFSLCVALPPGESELNEGRVVGRLGYLAPEYARTGIITTKVDVYSFGFVLLQLLTGRQLSGLTEDVMPRGVLLLEFVKENLAKEQMSEILDPRILGGEGGVEKEHKLVACLALALSCIQDRGEDRPEMIDVAKELGRIERAVRHSN